MKKITSNTTQCPIKNTKNAFKQKGITLIELMIALVLSGIVIAAVLINVATVSRTSIVQRSQFEMIEEGQLALRILSKHIKNAGYSAPSEIPEPLKDRIDRFGKYFLGCSENAISNTVAADIKNWGAACTGSAGGSESIAVRYQAGLLDDTYAHPLGIAYRASLSDCTGPIEATATNSITVDGKEVVISDSRFYIKDGALTCWGNNAYRSEVTLIKNVERMEFLYGVSERISVSSFEVLEGENSRYLTAAQLKSNFSSEGDAAWDRVTSVRICLIMRSKNPVPTAVQPYFNCAGVSTASPDGYLRKAMLTTVDIANMGSGQVRD